MGWDMHFFNSPKVSEILEKDDKIKIEFSDKENEYPSSLYMDDGKGHNCHIVLSDITKDNYKDEALWYSPRGWGNVGVILTELFQKFNIWFADEGFEDYCYLSQACENEDEEDKLMKYCIAEEMIRGIGDSIPEGHELRRYLEEYKPLRDELYQKYRELHVEDFKRMEESANKLSEKSNNDGLPF